MNFREIAEKSTGDLSENIIWHSENYSLEAVIYDRSTLVVTFEAAGAPFLRPNRHREGWGEELFRSKGISALHVKPMRVDWYRRPDLAKLLKRLRDNGFFDQFGQVITYGGSMGGFASLVYADLVCASKAIAVNPQSTLDTRKVPWESRFSVAQKYDWETEYSDVIDYLNGATVAFVIYDKLCELDRMHVERIRATSASLVELNIPFVGHHVPAHLAAIKAIKPLLFSIIGGGQVRQEFYKNTRARRNLARYFNTLSNRDRVKNSDSFSKIVAAYKQRSPLIGME